MAPVLPPLACHIPRSSSARRGWRANSARRHHLPDAGREAARRLGGEGRAARQGEELLAARLVLLPRGDPRRRGGDPVILIGAESTSTTRCEEAAWMPPGSRR